MKALKFIILVIMLTSCVRGLGNEPATKIGFTEIEKGIKDKFGNNAYYTNLLISYDKSIGNIVSVTVTKKPSSLKMGRWNQSQGSWKQNQDISIEVPDGSKASDFMFQLNEHLNLKKLGELTEKSSKQLTTEKTLKTQL